MRKQIKILFMFAFIFEVKANSQNKVKEFILKNQCGKKVVKLLNAWGSSNLWNENFTGDPNKRNYRSPTQNLGTWVEVLIEKEFIKVFRRTARTDVIKIWRKKDCFEKEMIKTKKLDEEYMARSFNDDTLKNIVDKYKKGVIYAWSPHMPLSVKGLKNIKKLSKEFGLKVYGVVDANSPTESVRKVASKSGISSLDQRKMESMELFMRGSALHFPSLLTFKDGKIKRHPKYGYEKKEEYKKDLLRFGFK